MTKGFVAVVDEMCPICLDKVTSSLAIQKRGMNTLDPKYEVLGKELCETCTDFAEKGYISFVEITNAEPNMPGTKMSQQEAKRTGRMFRMRRSLAEKILHPVPEEPLAFCSVEFFNKIQEKAQSCQKPESTTNGSTQSLSGTVSPALPAKPN